MIYFDNASTTKVLPEVVSLIADSLLEDYGNPSSIHHLGKKAKVKIESSRKLIAKIFNVSPKEIVFTSGGTEANNFILKNAVESLGVKHIITSKIEHNAVLNVVDRLKVDFNIKVSYVDVDEKGVVDILHLDSLLLNSKVKTLVSLMMVNNEIGTLLPIQKVGELCKKYNVLFHSDTVQAIGHYILDLQKIPIDFITASAHKFHGPKGVGFLFVREGLKVKSLIDGGGQEKGLRSGTENTSLILGMAKALDIVMSDLENFERRINEVKKYFVTQIQLNFKDAVFNGAIDNSISTIVNVRFSSTDKMILFKLDLKKICVSLGSACQSGADKGSHVINYLLSSSEAKKVSLRFSFSRFNEKSEVDKVIVTLKDLIK